VILSSRIAFGCLQFFPVSGHRPEFKVYARIYPDTTQHYGDHSPGVRLEGRESIERPRRPLGQQAPGQRYNVIRDERDV